MSELTEMVGLTWPRYRAQVSRVMSMRYGVGLDDIADCDLHGRDLFESDTDVVHRPKLVWMQNIEEDVEHALSEDDTFNLFFPNGFGD